MPIYFVKYTKGTAFREANLRDKTCKKNKGWHKNQYIPATGTVINNKNEELVEFSSVLL